MAFAQEMIDAKKELENKGHVVVVPEFAEVYITDLKWRKRAKRVGHKTAKSVYVADWKAKGRIGLLYAVEDKDFRDNRASNG